MRDANRKAMFAKKNKDSFVYKIKWKSGGETAERYSSKIIPNNILKRPNVYDKGEVVRTKLGEPQPSPCSGTETRWWQRPTKGGFVYTTRSVEFQEPKIEKPISKRELKEAIKEDRAYRKRKYGDFHIMR